MKLTLSAMIVAAGLLGLGAGAQSAPVSQVPALGAQSASPIMDVQFRRERRRMVRREMRREMRRDMRKRMIRRSIRRDMRR